MKHYLSLVNTVSHLFLDLDCKFACSLKFIHSPKVNTHGAFAVMCGHAQNSENCDCPVHTFPADVKQDDTLSSCFSSTHCKQVAFCSLFNAMFFTFLCLFLVILSFNMALKDNAEVLSTVPKY